MSNRLEFKEKTLLVKWKGQDFNLAFPTVNDGKNFTESIKDKSPSDVAEAILDFLAVLGLPKDVSSNMYEEDVVAVFDTIRGQKKSK